MSHVPTRALRRRVLPAVLMVCAALAALASLAAGVTGGTRSGQSMSMSMGTADHWRSVGGASATEAATGVTRTYYISADRVAWNYAPRGSNPLTGRPYSPAERVFVHAGPDRIGSRYTKCLYRGYADATFGTRTTRPAEEAYLGLLGPVIRAEVGDTIQVVFRNTCPFPTSVHPHGVFYDKSSEGAPYQDGTGAAAKVDDAVPTGGRHTYTWSVPERAGPAAGDGSSVMWMYHSHTDEVADTYAGLMGPMVITARGMARPDGSPADVDREVFALFAVMDENQSPFLRSEVRGLARPPRDFEEDEEFGESNLMHSINGYVYGNMPMINLRVGQRVRWYVMGMGTEVDLHTPHWHGNTVTVAGMRMDVVNLLPASMVVADMVPDDPGTWLFHCHVNDHIIAGMATRYRVIA